MSNEIVWDLSRGQFYEVYYFTINHHQSGRAFWLRSTLLKSNPDDPKRRAGLWLASFDPADMSNTFAIKKDFPAEETNFKPGILDLSIGNSHLREGHYKAKFSANGHNVSWDLQYAPHEEDIWLVPNLVRKTHINKADVCVGNVDILIYGTITIDGEEFILESEKAGESHHWGHHYAPEWLWGHCNDFDGREGAWIETLSTKFIKKGNLEIPATMLKLETGSARYGINNPVQLFKSNADYKDGTWQYSCTDRNFLIETTFHAEHDNFVCFPYRSPHNDDYNCYNSCIADCIVKVFQKHGGRYRQIDELISKGRAAAEYCVNGEQSPEAFSYKGFRKLKMQG